MAIKKPSTIRQKNLAKKIVDNCGTLGEAMIEVGYSENSAKNPHQIIDTNGFQKAFEPYAQRLKKHREEIINKMVEKVGEARYNELSTSLANVDKILRLESGTPTEITNDITKLSNDELKRLIAKSNGGTSNEGTV